LPTTASSEESAASDTPRREQKLSRLDAISAGAGLVFLVLTVLGFVVVPVHFGVSTDGFHRQFLLRLNLVLAGGFISAFCFAPVLSSLVRSLRKRWRDAYTYGALAGMCVVLWGFIVHFGRRQFGAWDYNMLIEAGWRQIQGQRPYVDFLTTTPPGFNLGIKFAYEMFGVNWNANLYFSAIFACLTFLWMYWLMVLLSVGRPASMAAAFAIECAAMLTSCFWWFNDSTLILAAVFLLACLAYARQPRSVSVQASYFLSLTLLSLMKPNIAGAMIVGGVALLFLATDQKMRLLLLTLGAAAAAMVVLFVNHVSIPSLLASYLSVAKGRSGLGDTYGYGKMSVFDRRSALFWVAVLSIPLVGLLPSIGRQILRRDRNGIAVGLLFLLAPLIALYGIATNSDYRDVECTALLAAGAVLTFGRRRNGLVIRRVYIAILCASVASDLYYGAIRLRVYGIGPHLFFEWQDNQHRIETGFLKDMRVSSTMIEAEREVKLAKVTNAGPYFFGPRMDFNYAVLGVPSPEHSFAWWEPGTSFAASDQERLLQLWRDHRFETLIFLKNEDPWLSYTFYPKEFLDAIKRGYVRDDRYTDITVYHRRD
jgi:hypothetical protein